MFPLFPFESISVWLNLSFALLIGIGFGVILEQSGLGNPKKLVGQFLLTDLTVFKVMFSAIATCMTLLFYLHYLGYIELSLLNQSVTAVWPQFIGGLILGVGFMLAGYCPGTAFVGLSSGHRDAMAAIAGLFVGSWLFALFFAWIEEFYHLGANSTGFLPDLVDADYGTLVFAILLTALICFAVAERIEANGKHGLANSKYRQKSKGALCD